jgi:hypothetical protein
MARIRRETPPGMKRSAFLYTTLSSFALLRPMRAGAAGSIADELAAIERSTGGRLGVAIIDTAGGDMITHRADERFPMCSTFKFLAVAAVLQRADSGAEKLDRRVSYSSADLLEYAPVTREHVKQGYMTVEALCDAAIRYSDNTAANAWRCGYIFKSHGARTQYRYTGRSARYDDARRSGERHAQDFVGQRYLGTDARSPYDVARAVPHR